MRTIPQTGNAYYLASGPGVIFAPLLLFHTSRFNVTHRIQRSKVGYNPYHTPVSKLYQWSIGIQHEFKYGVTSEIAYVASHGANLQFKGISISSRR